MLELKYLFERFADKAASRIPGIKCYSTSLFFSNRTENENPDEFDCDVQNKIKTAFKNRKNGPSICAVLRVKNGENFIKSSITSVLPLCSCIKVIDNNSTDKTAEIVLNLKKEYNNISEINYEKYPTHLSLSGNGYLQSVKKKPDSSLAKYYNHCFSNINTDFSLKLDAHCIYSINSIIEIQKKIKSGKLDVIYYRGIEFNGRKLSVEPYIISNKIAFEYVDGEKYEICKIPKNTKKGFVWRPGFLHIKRIFYNIHAFKDIKMTEAIYRE
ncbi:hypothetical protein [Thalassospira sp.]|uniref:hypothetical protein n=1 Tax=Thalassospira sp. TaxID=1912094 RepID=UPI003AA91677